MSGSAIRIGLIGFGKTGEFLFDQLQSAPAAGVQVSFVYNRSHGPLHRVPHALRLGNLAGLAERIMATGTRVVVEASHPSVTASYGAEILSRCSYMPMSLTALADPDLLARLTAIAAASGNTLYVSHGAVTALDSLYECRDLWDNVTVTMTKPPASLDFAVSGMTPPEGATPATLYDGPSAGICPLFPRNTNVHAAVALAGIGFQRTRSVLVADPSTTESRLEVKAEGPGVSLHIIRTNELTGVSGVMTLRAALGSLRTAANLRQPMVFC